ncbi:SRPBCC domain-containing protein [Niabella ginsengisoli]|uniref:SRPBCC domain-containing protein n=1 Tax=Niabella ginsengisoli TaxID=522298 RepID=A0ABS9SED0_9BACT|nr:SRPBCC domain-containing protein [Niabella ginsengisoli]MCH5596715.1 SRPBCC domain-containing protein [Niabella ginsengisoli]
MDKERIVVSELVQKPLEMVWNSWIDPSCIREWNMPFDDWHCPQAVNNVAIGGDFNFRMEKKDGSEGFNHKGKYDNVVRFELLEYTLDDGRKSTIEFQHIDDNTIVKESFEPEENMAVEMQASFCLSVLHRFKKYTENK